MPNDLLFWALAALATFLVGASKGGLPGVGILGVPILAQILPPFAAAGLLLPLFVVSDIYGLWLYRHSYSPWNIKMMTGASLIGIGLGWATASYNSDDLVKLIVGLIGIWFSVDLYFKDKGSPEPRPPDIPRGVLWGTVAGFTSFVAHAGGTAFQMYVLPQRLDKMVYAGTVTITFAIINLLKLPPYWLLGQINVTSLRTCLYLAPVALLGAWAGFKLTLALSEDVFFKWVKVAIVLVSFKLIYDAGSSWLS